MVNFSKLHNGQLISLKFKIYPYFKIKILALLNLRYFYFMKSVVKLLIIAFLFSSCKTGKLDVIADLPISLKESSAIEKIKNSDLLWVIQDSGNNNHLYGLNYEGKIMKDLTITNAENIDWEDLTSDSSGNIYIGDFGNNNKKRTAFTIYKVTNIEQQNESVKAEKIQFTLPEGMDSEDFESFFEYQGWFYLFSKNHKKTRLIKLPNTVGVHKATLISEFNLEGKHTRVTSADISEDGTTVVLLNHDKVWLLTKYSNDNFFNGIIERFDFEHDSQKEGITLLSKTEVLISDEQQKMSGGNIYKFKLKKE